jgi:ribose-phosphate pyrophosphokinase
VVLLASHNKKLLDEVKIFGGSGSTKLARNICNYLNVEPGRSEILHFSEGNIFVSIDENVRGKKIYIVQSIAYPVNDNFMELLFWIDAFKRASAKDVTAIIPYFGYAKGDKKDEPRGSVRARVCADAIESAGADRVILMDIHAPHITGFFKIPTDVVYARPVICKAIKGKSLPDLVVVSPDAGFAKQSRKFANYLGAPLAIAEKERVAHNEKVNTLNLMGDVAGKTAIIVDDFIVSGGTLFSTTKALLENGAKSVFAAVSHGVFSQQTLKKLEESPIKQLIITDSVETAHGGPVEKIEIVSVAPLLGDLILRINNNESISSLID